MNRERILNVAKALRESQRPEDFDMSTYGHACGTPACAFGHYCARTDLQDMYRLDARGNPVFVAPTDPRYQWAHYDDSYAQEHFGLDKLDLAELFEEPSDSDEDGEPCGGGCGGARTAIEAAEYIERFVAEREGKP